MLRAHSAQGTASMDSSLADWEYGGHYRWPDSTPVGPAGVTVVYTLSLGLTLVSTTNSRRINASAGKTPMHCGWSWVRSVRCCDGMVTTARPYLRAHARTPPHDGQPGTVGGGLPCGVLLAYPWLTAEYAERQSKYSFPLTSQTLVPLPLDRTAGRGW